MSFALFITTLDATSEAMTNAAVSSRSLAVARRDLANANTHAADSLGALQREAGAFGTDVIVPDGAAVDAMRRGGSAGNAGHSGGYITAAYAEQLVTAYAALLTVMATPNVSPFAYNEANASTTRMQMFWQLLGFNKYGSLEALARAKMRTGGAAAGPNAGGKKPTPGATPSKPAAGSSISEQQGSGALRW